MDLFGAINSEINKEREKLKNETDKNKQNKIRKKLEKYYAVSRAVSIKDDYNDFLNNRYTSFDEEYFNDEKIMSNEQYEKLKKIWSKKVSEKLTSREEELVRCKIENVYEENKNLTKEEIDKKVSKVKRQTELDKEFNERHQHLKVYRKTQSEKILKMKKQERLEYTRYLFGKHVEARPYKNTLTIKSNKE